MDLPVINTTIRLDNADDIVVARVDLAMGTQLVSEQVAAKQDVPRRIYSMADWCVVLIFPFHR